MRFGRTLRNAIYPPWKDQYIDYGKLKSLLRENEDDDQPWTEDDESKFCDEILNVQLEKVAAFQASKFKELEHRANQAGETLRDMIPEDGQPKGDITTGRLKEIEEGLDSIINEMKELKKYSSINYTGFLKIVKKHDRKRGSNYKIRPMVQISLAKRPFNSEEGYSALSNKLSMLYFAVRQQLDEGQEQHGLPPSDAQPQNVNDDKYTAYKCEYSPDKQAMLY
jgi:SPX domain protein involved in polyphosphate accumulation